MISRASIGGGKGEKKRKEKGRGVPDIKVVVAMSVDSWLAANWEWI